MHILNLTTVYLKKKRLLAGIPLLCAVLAFAISSFMPKIYYTETRLKIDDPLPAKMTGILSADMSKNLSNLFGGTMKNESEDLFLELLCSRDNFVSAIKKFSLDTLYKTKYMEAALKSFKKSLKVDIENNDIIFCGFRDKNRDLAAAVVRFLVNNANNKFISLKKERLAMNTAFIADRNKQLMDSLEINFQELIAFYRDNNVISIKDQIELTMLTLARYEEQINSNKVNEIISKSAAGANTPLSQELKARNQALQQEFQKIRGEYNEDYKPSKQSVLINTDWGLDKMLFEQITTAKISILKDFLDIMSKELALSETQLSKNIPAVQIIQDAYYPDWKIAPRRLIWIGTAFSVALSLTISFVTLNAFLGGELEGSSDANRQKLSNLIKVIWK